MDIDKIKNNKEAAINAVETLLNTLISSDDEKNHKKANLLSYWIKEYTNYLKVEDTFIPQKQENYKRGDIIKVNLGFNIGNEEGGLHYAIVVNNPAKSSGVVTIVPLTSAKSNSKSNSSTVNLGNSIMKTIILKLKAIHDSMKPILESIPYLKDQNLIDSKICEVEKQISELDRYITEAEKMKRNDSIALVGNITTISKQRIYTPTTKNKFLKNISLSNEQLDLIDNKIRELYTKDK